MITYPIAVGDAAFTGREVFIEMPQPGRENEAVIEIQYPVAKVVDGTPLLS